ncbi:hypothetical protein ACTJJ4_11575 [Microbacterium sp. 22195]|uniref:hypothetical protein n=1 Tax=Microbacterium sp. 22195 TaxID=3453891 RepID=UPI003F8631B3
MTDFSDVRKLSAELASVPEETKSFARKALQVTAHHIRDDWRAAANRTGLAGYARDVTYDTQELAHSVKAEIGPTPGDAGSFGLVEDGGGGVRSKPQHAGRDALEKAEPDFVRGMEAAIADGVAAALRGS